MTKPSRILFVADAGPAVGGGHVMRCLTLAEALTAAGASCGFAATPAVAGLLDVFAGPSVARFSAPQVAGDDLVDQAVAVAKAWGAAGAVIDHYGISATREVRLAEAVRGALAIDDLCRSHACDLVLDSNLGRTGADYPGHAVLGGPHFALVRPGFAALRGPALARRRAAPAVGRVLISLGLTDVGAITARVVRALLPILGDSVLDAVVGGAAPSLPALRQLAADDPRVVLHVDSSDMPALTAAADLAVGAGGSSTWERCSLGLPTITLVLADNQRANALSLARAGAVVMIEAQAGGLETENRRAVAALIASPDARLRLANASAGLCDGLGARRVAEQVLQRIGAALPGTP